MRTPARLVALAAGAVAVAAVVLPPLAGAAPTWLSPAAPLDSMPQQTGPLRVAFAPDGSAVAVWTHAVSGSNSYIRASTRAAGAGAWSSPVDLTSTSGLASSPEVVIDGAGNATAAWSAFDGSNNRIQSAVLPNGGSWSTPVDTLSDTSQNSLNVKLAVAGDGKVTAVWRSGFRIQYADRPLGGPWTTADYLSSGGFAAEAPQVAVDASGNAVAVWRRINGLAPPATYKIEGATRSAGQAWSAESDVSVATNLADAADPDVDIFAGKATALWTQSDGTKARINVADHPLAGSWSAPLSPPLSDATYDASVPDVDLDGAGVVTAVWAETTAGAYRIRTATRDAGGTTWSAATTLGSGTVLPGLQQGAPHVDVAPDGHATAAWLARTDDDYVIQGAGRVPGGSWTSAHDLTPATTFGGYPDVAVDVAGNAMACWWTVGTSFDLATAVLDGAGPTVAATAPASGKTGQQLTFSATASDVWSEVTSYTWSFGDGGAGSGAQAGHAYVNPGTYAVSVTATDAVGNSTTVTAGSLTVSQVVTPSPTPTLVPPDKPVLSKVSLTEPRIRAVGALGVKLPRKTKLKLTLNVDALVRIHVNSVTPGGLKRAFNADLLAGSRTVAISARVAGTKLPPGRYKVVVRAHNSAGTSVKKFLKLRIVGED